MGDLEGDSRGILRPEVLGRYSRTRGNLGLKDTEQWGPPRNLADLYAADLAKKGISFAISGTEYRSMGLEVGHGGMGSVYALERRGIGPDHASAEPVVAKVFHAEYLLQLRTDQLSRLEHQKVMANIDAIAKLEHPRLLPTLAHVRIRDNYLLITPRRACTLREAIAKGVLSPRRKVELLLQGMAGLFELHRNGFLHRDFTLRNILVDEGLESAFLFDFDLSLKLSDVEGEDYKSKFGGRIFGSPGYSLAPEVIDSTLMTSPIEASLDIYALGTSIFALFTEELPYGEAEDMWSLLLRVSEGVVRGDKSSIPYPNSVPLSVRPIIEACMQRSPELRPKSVGDVMNMLGETLPRLQREKRRSSNFSSTVRYGDGDARRRALRISGEGMETAEALIAAVDRVLQPQGYQLQRNLGTVKKHAIFKAIADPELVASGRFPGDNPYPKIVTAIELRREDDPLAVVEAWMSRYSPALRKARNGLMTPLSRVLYGAEEGVLLVLSEFVEGARFGTALAGLSLSLLESFGLAFLVGEQIMRLHSHGLAHNNVRSEALLIKGDRTGRRALPAMVGIVAPTESEADMQGDTKALAKMLLEWLGPEPGKGADPDPRERIASIAGILGEIKIGGGTMSELLMHIKDALSALDFNAGVLRENGGDLNAYAILLVGPTLYGRLWSEH